MLAVVAYCSSTSKRWTAPKRPLHERRVDRVLVQVEHHQRRDAAHQPGLGLRLRRAQQQVVAIQVDAVGGGALAEGGAVGIGAGQQDRRRRCSRTRSKRPAASCCAKTSSASVPAGSSPCWPATTTTAGRRPIEAAGPEVAATRRARRTAG